MSWLGVPLPFRNPPWSLEDDFRLLVVFCPMPDKLFLWFSSFMAVSVSARLQDSVALWLMTETPGVLPELSGLLVSTHASVLVAESAGHVPLSL